MFEDFLQSQSEEIKMLGERKRNNWRNSILSLFIVGIFLASVGVPIYGLISASAAPAIPYEFVNNENTQMHAANSNPTFAGMGDIIGYYLSHWFHMPSIEYVVGLLSATFAAYGAVVNEALLTSLGYAILASDLSTSVLITLIGVDLTNPVGQAVLAAIAGYIIGA